MGKTVQSFCLALNVLRNPIPKLWYSKIAYTAFQHTFAQLNSFTQGSCPQSSPAGSRIKCHAQVLLRKRGENCFFFTAPPSPTPARFPESFCFIIILFWSLWLFEMLLFMLPPVNKWAVSPTLGSLDSYIANQSSFSSISDKDLHYYKNLRNLWVFNGLYYPCTLWGLSALF